MWLNRALGTMRSLSRVGTWVAGALLLGAAVLIGVEVLLRKFFGTSTGGSTEISSYVLAIATTWSLSFALFEKAHIRIDVLSRRLSKRIQALLELLAMLMLAGFILPLTYYGFKVAQTSFLRGSTANTPLSTPLWIPQGLWEVGLIFFSLVIVGVTVKVATLLAQRRYAEALHVMGPDEADGLDEHDKSDAPGEPTGRAERGTTPTSPGTSTETHTDAGAGRAST